MPIFSSTVNNLQSGASYFLTQASGVDYLQVDSTNASTHDDFKGMSLGDFTWTVRFKISPGNTGGSQFLIGKDYGFQLGLTGTSGQYLRVATNDLGDNYYYKN